ncbi:MAG TPA: hypothetical protein VGO47_02150 [Chlamydiales bacterium]|jgi:hypothetical protein|nr:hypothetical protein [Chlamydiales bacterium]
MAIDPVKPYHRLNQPGFELKYMLDIVCEDKAHLRTAKKACQGKGSI